MTSTSIILNGRQITANLPPRTHLGDFIRERGALTGTHLGCEHGICGACTVEIDGQIARSCITFAVSCNGAAVRTIEGFDGDPLMARLRQTFTEEHALQCGYCTPGMLIAARDLIRRKAARTEDEIRVAMSGNLCRCTGYSGIVSAVARVMREEIGKGEAAEQFAPMIALGPVGSFSVAGSEARAAKSPDTLADGPRPLAGMPRQRRRIAVSTGVPKERDGYTCITQAFVLPHPVQPVWEQMQKLEALVSCLPGAQLTEGPSSGGLFEGTIALSLGPIRPAFKGRGELTISNAERSGEVTGAGIEERRGSKASGRMTFSLKPEGQFATHVSVELAYKLTGPLAQFARPSLVTGVLGEAGTAFASNLESLLSGEELSANANGLGLKSIFRGLWQGLARVLLLRRQTQA